MSEGLQIVVVVDGARDGTEESVRAAAGKLGDAVTLDLVVLTRNFGEHAAVLAGLAIADGEIVITMDDDLQHRPEDAKRLVAELHAKPHLDVIYGQFPVKRHAAVRNLGSWVVDRVVSHSTGKPLSVRVTTFRGIRRVCARAASEAASPLPYIDGLLLQMTDRIGGLDVEHGHRQVGGSTYSARKLISLAGTIVTGVSILPLRVSLFVGAFSAAVGFGAALVGLVEWVTVGTAPGWLSVFSAVTISSGVTLVAIGVVGEYLGRVVVAISGRKAFHVRSHTRFPGSAHNG